MVWVGHLSSVRSHLRIVSAPHFVAVSSPSHQVSLSRMIFGPPEQKITSLSALNTSTQDIWNVVNGSYKSGVPPTAFPAFVDVRDVAIAHVRATEREEAKGQRYLFIGDQYVSAFPLLSRFSLYTIVLTLLRDTILRKTKKLSTLSPVRILSSLIVFPKSTSPRSRTTIISRSTVPR